MGAGGVILHYAGGTWQFVTSPTTMDVSSVAMVSADEGWAVGGWHNPALLERQLAYGHKPDGVSLRSVVMVSAKEGWEAGPSDTLR